MKKYNMYSITSGIIAFIGCFLPYYYISWYGSGSLLQNKVYLFKEKYIGIAIMILSLLMVLFAFIKKKVLLIITTIILMILEAIFMYIALTEQPQVFIIRTPDNGVLLLQGFYLAVSFEILSVISLVKSKNYYKKVEILRRQNEKSI